MSKTDGGKMTRKDKLRIQECKRLWARAPMSDAPDDTCETAGPASTRAFCHYAAPYPFCMENPYRYSKCQ